MLDRHEQNIDLNDIQEGANYNVQPNKEGSRQVLKGFKLANIHIHLLSDDVEKLYTKSKFHDLFDIGVLSIFSANKIDENMNTIFKKGALVHVESADMMVPLSKL